MGGSEMNKVILMFVLVASFFCGYNSVLAGVEPSPFKEIIRSKIDLIVERLEQLTDSTGGVNEYAEEIADYLRTVEDQPIRRKMVAVQSVIIMERITSVLINPQPEPPGYQLLGLNILSRLSAVAFDPQPEPPGHIMRSLAVLDRISAVGFDPQPEPPGRVSLFYNTMDALESISAIAFDPQPEPPGKATDVMQVFDAVSAIAFDPQPEPPGKSILEMFRVLDLLGKIAEPETTAY